MPFFYTHTLSRHATLAPGEGEASVRRRGGQEGQQKALSKSHRGVDVAAEQGFRDQLLLLLFAAARKWKCGGTKTKKFYSHLIGLDYPEAVSFKPRQDRTETKRGGTSAYGGRRTSELGASSFEER